MASQNPFPMMPPISTELRLAHFDEQAYTGTPDTLLYKFVDALCGTTGAGDLLNQAFLSRLSNSLDNIYFNELDYVFSKIQFLARSPAESYTYSPMTEMLTPDQWNEVRVKDAWYRARIKDFFTAATLGGTPQGLRVAVQAALGVDCTLFENWRYIDNFGLGSNVGRAPTAARNEVTVRPHKTSLAPEEFRLLRDMLSKMMPVDAIITINVRGLAILSPVRVAAATANSTYFEIQKSIQATPVIKSIPAPADLALELSESESWLFKAKETPQIAPYAAFNVSSEYGYYYLVGAGERSPIDSVTYGTMQADGSVRSEPNFEIYQSNGSFTDWITYELADSPDNYPGGKYGITPYTAPALNPDRSPYQYPWESQAAYIASKMKQILNLGGIADFVHYRLPLKEASNPKTVYLPEYAVANSAPAQESTVSSSLTYRRPSTLATDWSDPTAFVST